MDVDMGAEAPGRSLRSASTSSLGGGGAHEEKFRVYNDALVHAASCADAQCQAHNGRCHKVKASIDHFVRCYGPRRTTTPIESCEACSKIWGLLCYHAKYCQTPFGGHCAVSQCNYLRDKIARKRESDKRELEEARVKMKEKLEEWPVERRIAQVEADRQQVLQLIADIRARKAQQQQQQQQQILHQQQPMMSMS